MRECIKCGAKLYDDRDNVNEVCLGCLAYELGASMRKDGLISEISISWCAEDVIDRAYQLGHLDITPKEVEGVLTMLEREHDATLGISWETIDYWIYEIIKERSKV